MPRNSKFNNFYFCSDPRRPKIDSELRAVLTQLMSVVEKYDAEWVDESQINFHLSKVLKGGFNLECFLAGLKAEGMEKYVRTDNVKIRGEIYCLTIDGKRALDTSPNSTYTENPKHTRDVRRFHSMRGYVK